MKLTLPISHLINTENYLLVPGVQALEFKKKQPVFDYSGPLFFHSGKGIIDEDFIDYFDNLLPYLNENKFQHFSFDLGPATPKYKIEDYYYVTEEEVLTAEEISCISKERLNYVKKNFKGIVALENLNYFPTSAYSHVCEPDFFSKVVRDNDVYCILDIAHAMISAHNLGIDWQDYFLQMPLERVKEIHLSTHGIVDGKWRDLHERPNDETLKVLQFIWEKLTSDAYLIIEFYKNFEDLVEIYNETSLWIDKSRLENRKINI
mgnify:FL=1